MGWPLSGYKLCPDGDPPLVRPGETVHLRHVRSLTHAILGPRSEDRLPTAAAAETSVPRPVAAIVGVNELERGRGGAAGCAAAHRPGGPRAGARTARRGGGSRAAAPPPAEPDLPAEA